MHVLHNFFRVMISTTAYHLCWYCLHLILLKSSMILGTWWWSTLPPPMSPMSMNCYAECRHPERRSKDFNKTVLISFQWLRAYFKMSLFSRQLGGPFNRIVVFVVVVEKSFRNVRLGLDGKVFARSETAESSETETTRWASPQNLKCKVWFNFLKR